MCILGGAVLVLTSASVLAESLEMGSGKPSAILCLPKDTDHISHDFELPLNKGIGPIRGGCLL